MGECGLEVGPEVVRVFDANAEPEQAGREVVLARDGGAALDRGLDRSEAGRMTDQFDALADEVGRRCAAGNVEGDHAAERGELFDCDPMCGMCRQSGVADDLDGGVLDESPGDFAG